VKNDKAKGNSGVRATAGVENLKDEQTGGETNQRGRRASSDSACSDAPAGNSEKGNGKKFIQKL